MAGEHNDAHLHPLTNVPTRCQPSTPYRIQEIAWTKDFIYFGFYVAFNTTGYITTGSWKGRGNQYIQFVRVLYCKLPTNGKQLPAFPLETVRGSNPGLRGGRRECCHRGPTKDFKTRSHYKVKSRSHHDVADLQFLSNVPTKY